MDEKNETGFIKIKRCLGTYRASNLTLSTSIIKIYTRQWQAKNLKFISSFRTKEGFSKVANC